MLHYCNDHLDAEKEDQTFQTFAVIGIAMIATKKLHAGKPIPFGPYIAIAGWIALIWGQEIINWYLSTLV